MLPAESPLLQRALRWSKQLPPYARVWLDDHLWTDLAEELCARAWMSGRTVETPAPPLAFSLRTILFCKRSDRVTG